jgi:hypothetical protein
MLVTAQPYTTANHAATDSVLETSHHTTTSNPSNPTLMTLAAGTMCPTHVRAKQASSATTPSDQVTPASMTPDTRVASGPANEDWPIDPRLLVDVTAANANLRLERTKANSEKKRKPEGKNAPSASKKQKTQADGLAIPDNANSIKCMPYFEVIPFNASFQKHIHAILEHSASRRSRSSCQLRCILQDTVS